MQDKQSLIEDIRSGKIDINNQELFFSILIKGLMSKLDDNIKIRGVEGASPGSSGHSTTCANPE